MSSSDNSPPTPSLPHKGGRGSLASDSARLTSPPAPLRGGEGGREAPPLSPWERGGGRGASVLSRRTLLLAPLALAACGFTPAYAPGGPATKLLGTVRARDPSDKNGFDLVERLEERLGRPENHRYDLAYTITTEAVGVGITTENEITRFNLKGVIDYTLSDSATGARLAGGRVQSFTAWSATGSTIAGLAAEENAAFRLMRILADQITSHLIAASATFP